MKVTYKGRQYFFCDSCLHYTVSLWDYLIHGDIEEVHRIVLGEWGRESVRPRPSVRD